MREEILVPYAQDAVKGPKVLIAAINPITGRQVVRLFPSMIQPPLIELRCNGWKWHDKQGHEWMRDPLGWRHSISCICGNGRKKMP